MAAAAVGVSAMGVSAELFTAGLPPKTRHANMSQSIQMFARKTCLPGQAATAYSSTATKLNKIPFVKPKRRALRAFFPHKVVSQRGLSLV